MTYEYPAEAVHARAKQAQELSERYERLKHDHQELSTNHDELVNELLERAPERYDGDWAAEALLVQYVRDLESVRDRAIAALTQLSVLFTIVPDDFTTDHAAKWSARTARELAEKSRLADDSDEHFHEDGKDCKPGCACFDIAEALFAAYRKAATDTDIQVMCVTRPLLRHLVLQLLKEGAVYR